MSTKATGAVKRPPAIGYTDFVKSFPNKTAESNFKNMARKALGSTDVNQLRLVSMFPEMTTLRNEETVMLNIVEANPIFRATDLQVRINEKRIGTDTSEFFAMDGAVLPGNAQSNRPMRYNSTGFFGESMTLSYLAQELASQSPLDPTDLYASEMTDHLVRLRQFLNRNILTGAEQSNEALPNITRPGGFIDRSVLYNFATAGDLTNPLIQGRVSAVANLASPEGLTFNVPLIALCQEGQISKVDDLMISRYPGETSAAHMGLVASLLARLESFGISPDMVSVYKPRPGRPVIFILEKDLPAGTCLFFDPRQPRLARLQIMGQFGPWVLQRPTTALVDFYLIWDGYSLVDPYVESRAILTGLNP
jgi:hypothetical protein